MAETVLGFSPCDAVGRSSMNDPNLIDEVLRTARTIAVVGMSDKTSRASHHIGAYLA